MAKKIVAVAAILLIVWGIAFLAGGSGEPASPEHPVAPPADRADAVLASGPEAPAPTTPDEVAREAVAVADRTPTPELALATAGALIVRVRWSDDSPSVGIAVDFRDRRVTSISDGLARVVTDALGVARADGLPPGELELSTERGGEQTAEVVAGEEREVELTLPDGITVRGVVVDENDVPVSGAEVWLANLHTDWQGGHVVAVADGEGRFELARIPTGASVGAIAPGYYPSRLIDLDVLDKSAQPVQLLLRVHAGGGGLRGQVLLPKGEPAAGAWVAVGEPPAYIEWREDDSWEEAWTPRTARCDAEGRYVLRGLVPGEHPLRARVRGFPVAKVEATVVAGSVGVVDVQIAAPGVLEGTVVDAEGLPSIGAVVRVFDEPIDESFIQFGQYDHRDAFGYPFGVTDGDGRYRIEALPPGELRAYANPKPDPYRHGSELRDQTVLQAAPGATLRWDAVLDPGPTIRGRVTYRDGRPLVMHFVSARDEASGASATTTTDGYGGFELFNLEPAPHTLSVQLWFAPPDSEPLGATGVYPDTGEVLLVASFDGPDDDHPGQVRGRVDDLGDRLPLPERMVVHLESDQGFWRINSEGEDFEFHFPAADPGRYRPLVLAGDLPVVVGEWFELGPGEIVDVGTLVTEPGGTLLVRVERAEGTEGVELRVHARMKDSINGFDVPIGRDEELRVVNLSAGSYDLRAWAPEIVNVAETVEIVPGEEPVVVLRLELAATQPFEVSWPAGAELESLRVTVTGADGRSHFDLLERNADALPIPYERQVRVPSGTFTLRGETGSGLTGEVVFEVGDVGTERAPLTLTLR